MGETHIHIPSWIQRLKSRSFALILAIPFIFGVFLFEKFQNLRFKSAEDEARRFLFECANSMAEDFTPNRALYSAYQSLYPNGWVPLHNRFPSESLSYFGKKASNPKVQNLIASWSVEQWKMAPGLGVDPSKDPFSFTAQKTLDALSPYLKSTKQGIRLFLFDTDGKCGYALSPPELVASNSELWRGSHYAIHADLSNPRSAPLVEVASKAWDIILRRFQNRVTFSDFVFSTKFNLVVPTDYSSATYFLRQGLFAGNGRPGILLEIDWENVNQDAVQQRGLDQWSVGVEMAALIDANGLTERMNARGAFSPDQSFPIPHQENSVEFFPEGFFLKRPMEGGLHLVLGIGPPTLSSLSNTARWVLEVILIMAFLIFSRRLGESLIEESGEAQISLSRQLAGLFFIAALVPLLTLVFFGFHQALESPKAEEMSWIDRMHRQILGMDRCFHQTKERYQRKLHEMAWNLGIAASDGKSIESVLSRSACLDLFFMDNLGHHFTTLSAKEMSSNDSNRLVFSLLKSYLKYYQQALSQEKGSGKPEIPQVIDVFLEELLRMNSPVRDFFFNQGKIGLFKVFTGDILNSYSEVVIGPGDLIQGAFMSFMHVPRLFERLIYRDFIKKKSVNGMNLFSLYKGSKETRYFGTSDTKNALPLLQKSSERQAEIQTRYEEKGRAFLFFSANPSFIQNATLGASIDLAHIKRRIRAHLRELAFLTLLGAAIALYVGFLIRRHLLLPLKLLRTGVERISQGHFAARLPVESRDELGRLHETFNKMAEGLQQRERMKRFVSREVWATTQSEQTTQSAQMKKIDAAILFCDIRGFTTMSETMAAPDIVTLLNEYFSAMDSIIRRFGGEIDKLIGDAILAIFRPEPGKPDPANRAVMAGLAMRATLSHFNRRRETEGKWAIEIGTGIHFGPLIEGRVGSARGRLDLTVVGSALSQAMRLEGASKRGKATKIIVSAATAIHLKGEFPLVPLEGDESGLQEVLKPWDTIPSEPRPEAQRT